jgi:hypothetical protein
MFIFKNFWILKFITHVEIEKTLTWIPNWYVEMNIFNFGSYTFLSGIRFPHFSSRDTQGALQIH